MPSYQDLLTQVCAEYGYTQRSDADKEFDRSLCEVALCLALALTMAKTAEAPMRFYPTVPMDVFQPLPIVDINQGADIEHSYKNIMIPLAVRDQSGRYLRRSGTQSLHGILTSFIDTQDEPLSWYRMGCNLVGIRPFMPLIDELTLVYVPYIEVNNLSELVPIEDIQLITRFIRIMMHCKFSRFDLVKLELERLDD